jgi:hypothetical protein
MNAPPGIPPGGGPTPPKSCPRCAYPNPPSVDVCIRCSASLTGAQSPSGGGALKLFAPVIIALVLVMGTVVFIRDFRGFNVGVRGAGLLLIGMLIVLPAVAFLFLGPKGLRLFGRYDDRD